MTNIEVLIKKIESFEPIGEDWVALDDLIEQAGASGSDLVVLPLLRILERNPDHDGYGVFWSIVHALEDIDGYETALVNSVLSNPHELSVMMLNRILNSGQTEIDGTPIIKILGNIASNEQFNSSIREDAAGYIKHQQKNT